MSILRPATPGFITTLAATVILIVVSFSVPYFKSVFFLKASLAVEGISGNITFGVLGYCIEQSNVATNCSKAAVGWQFNPNELLGDNSSLLQIPTIAVKWITYGLVLHIVALGLAAIASVFGLLAHVREMSMSCLSSCVSGFAAVVTLIAFIFDLVLFFLVKARIDSVQNGSASIGNGIWLTLASWILLFFSGCMYGFGRCCIAKRPRGPRGQKDPEETFPNKPGPDLGQAEAMRLDAVKAEADRKARQKAGTHEVGLPTFQEYETRPLTGQVDPEPQYLEEEEDGQALYRDNSVAGRAGLGAAGGLAAAGPEQSRRQGTGYMDDPHGGAQQTNRYPGGYVQGAPGTRAVDDYYNQQPPQHTSPPGSTYSSPRPAHTPGPVYPPTDAYGQLYGGPEHVDPAAETYHDPYNQVYSSSADVQSPQDPYGHAYGGSTDVYNPQDPYTHPQHQSSYYSAQTHWQNPSTYSQQQPEPSTSYDNRRDPSIYSPSPGYAAYSTPLNSTPYGGPQQTSLAPPPAHRAPSAASAYFPHQQGFPQQLRQQSPPQSRCPPLQRSQPFYPPQTAPIDTVNALPSFPSPTSPQDRATRRRSVGGPRLPRTGPSSSSPVEGYPTSSSPSPTPLDPPPVYEASYPPARYPPEKR